MATIIDGKATAATIRTRIRQKAIAFEEQRGIKPHLAAILVGSDPASETYVNYKMKACREVNFQSSLVKYKEDVAEQELLKKIQELNEDPTLHGFIVQLPLPRHIDVNKVIQAIDYRKDVDGFHPVNIGRMTKGLPALLPATPYGILMLLQEYNIPTRGKHCVVIGRSQIVGTPMSILMSRDAEPGNCTVTLAHRYSKDLPAVTRIADIVISAVGKPGLVAADMIKEGAVLVDVGTTRVEDASKKSGFRLAGDMDYNALKEKAAAITPVPGGVGPMTITALLMNTLTAARGEVFNQ